MQKPTKVLAFAASNSRNSINKQLVTHAANVLKTEIYSAIDTTVLDLNDYEMPIYSIDRENLDGIPEAAKIFYREIGRADALLISYAEHNGTYTAAFKNIFDWCSRINSKVFQNKPMLVMAASPGAGGASSVLKTAADSAFYFGADIRGILSVGRFSENFDHEKEELSNAELLTELRERLSVLIR